MKILKNETQKFYSGGFCPGGFCLGGFLSEGICLGGFCPGTISGKNYSCDLN